MEGLVAVSPFTLPPPPFRIKPEADVAQLVEQPIRNALSLAYVVVEYGGLRVVLGGSRVSLALFVQRFVPQFD
jgi:hypothetical protein